MPLPTTPHGRTSRKKRVLNALLDGILSKRYPPGSQLEPIKVLARRFDTSVFTVQQALNVLEEKGYITKYHGSGTYVNERPDELTMADAVVLCMEVTAHVYGDLSAMLMGDLHTRGRAVVTVDTGHDQKNTMLRRAVYSEARTFVIHGSKYFPFGELVMRPFLNKTLIGVLDWETRFQFDRVHMILVDHDAGGRLVARYLREAGHRTAAVIGPEDMLAGMKADRPQLGRHSGGFAQEWEALGGRIITMRSRTIGLDVALDEDALIEAVSGPNGATAIFGLRDVEAWHAQCIITRRRPDLLGRLGLIGYGDTPYSRIAHPPIATVSWNLRAVADATSILLERLRTDPTIESVQQIIQPEIIVPGARS